MTLEEYAKAIDEVAEFPRVQVVTEVEIGVFIQDTPWVGSAMGLVEESGEVMGKLRKVIRDKEGIITEEDHEAISAELGDVLYNWVRLCTELHIDMGHVMRKSVEKLLSRKRRGVISGSGDYR